MSTPTTSPTYVYTCEDDSCPEAAPHFRSHEHFLPVHAIDQVITDLVAEGYLAPDVTAVIDSLIASGRRIADDITVLTVDEVQVVREQLGDLEAYYRPADPFLAGAYDRLVGQGVAPAQACAVVFDSF